MEMTFRDIANMPTSVTPEMWQKALGCSGIHESCLQAYQILRMVKVLLNDGTSAKLTLTLIDLMESDHFKPIEVTE